MQNPVLSEMIDYWSFSKLKKSACLERLYHYVTLPKPPHGSNDDQTKGLSNHDKIHTAIDYGFKNCERLSPKTESFIKMMIAGSMDYRCEQKLSGVINGVEIVGVPDLLIFNSRGGTKCCTIVDFKLMKGNEDIRQLQTYAMLVKHLHPEVEFFSGTFFYTELEFYDPIHGSYYRDFAGDIEQQYKDAIKRCEGVAFPTPNYSNCQYCDHPDRCSIARNIEIPQITDYKTAVEVSERLAALEAVTGKVKRLVKAYMETSGVPLLALKKGKVMLVTAAPSMKILKTAANEAELALLTSFAQAQRIEMAEPVKESEPEKNNPQVEETKPDVSLEPVESPVKKTPASEVKAEPCPFGDPEPKGITPEEINNLTAKQLFPEQYDELHQDDEEPETNEIPACPDCVHYDQEQGSGSTMGVICKKGHDMDCNGKDFLLVDDEPEKNMPADSYKNEQETGWYNKKTGFPVVVVGESKGWIVRYKTDKGFSTIRKMSGHASSADVALKLFVAAYENSTAVEFRNSEGKTETIKEPIADAKGNEECNYCKMNCNACICADPVSDELSEVVKAKFKRVFPGKDEAGFLQFRTEAADRAECFGFNENSNRVASVVFKMLNVLIQNAND